MHNDQRNLETIPTGALGIIPLESCREIGEKVDKYLVKWRCVREHEHEDDIAPAEFKEREGKRRHRRGNDAHNA